MSHNRQGLRKRNIWNNNDQLFKIAQPIRQMEENMADDQMINIK